MYFAGIDIHITMAAVAAFVSGLVGTVAYSKGDYSMARFCIC